MSTAPQPKHTERARKWLTSTRDGGPRLDWFATQREVDNVLSLLAPSLAALLAEVEAEAVAERKEE